MNMSKGSIRRLIVSGMDAGQDEVARRKAAEDEKVKLILQTVPTAAEAAVLQGAKEALLCVCSEAEPDGSGLEGAEKRVFDFFLEDKVNVWVHCDEKHDEKTYTIRFMLPENGEW